MVTKAQRVVASSSFSRQIGNDDRTVEAGLDSYFENIPASMFTAFRHLAKTSNILSCFFYAWNGFVFSIDFDWSDTMVLLMCIDVFWGVDDKNLKVDGSWLNALILMGHG